MPEGPSIVLLKEAVQSFIGKKVIEVSGNRKIDIQRLDGLEVLDFKSYGKQFLIEFENLSVRIHFLLFGSYRINERKETPPRLSLLFENGELNFYGCSVRFVEEKLEKLYDWSTDVMSEKWNPRAVKKKLKDNPTLLVCDALLDQEIFAGVGNIIKNEVLYRIKVHPENQIAQLPPRKVNELIKEARNYCFEFKEWKKNFVLKKNWLAHTKRTCKRCDLPFVKQHLGKTNRRTFFCNSCQLKYQ